MPLCAAPTVPQRLSGACGSAPVTWAQSRGAQLVDALPAKQYVEERLPGVINIPLKQVVITPGESSAHYSRTGDLSRRRDRFGSRESGWHDDSSEGGSMDGKPAEVEDGSPEQIKEICYVGVRRQVQGVR